MAAAVAWREYHDFTQYVPLRYGDPLPELDPSRALLFLDYAPKRAVLRELSARHPHILVLDHHKTAKEDLAGVEAELPNVTVGFDMTRSGAMLAWEHFHGDPAPDAVRYVQDRDLWLHQLPDTHEVSAALASFPYEPQRYAQFLGMSAFVELMAREGRALLRAKQQQVEGLLAEARVGYIRGNAVPVVNAPTFLVSDLGNALLTRFPEAPFAAVYRDGAKGVRYWSLRSTDDRKDVSEIAKQYGGGGHRNASGFEEASAEACVTFGGAYSTEVAP
jgi:oligoribonuclease NrnB/cAMP/cGMP phosphodiesterase (DHH superfamily)